MRLGVMQLEDREIPAYDLGNGVALLDSGVMVRPFEDSWTGRLNILVTPDGTTVIGAGPGGGPRVASLDPRGIRTAPDYFAGDPDSRQGVIPVAVPTGKPNTVLMTGDLPPMSYGPADGYPVKVTFDEPVTSEFAERVLMEAADVMHGTPFRFTTDRPNTFPNEYGEVVIVGTEYDLAPLLWVGENVGGVASVGSWARGEWSPEVFVRRTAYPRSMAVIMAHEIGHAALDELHHDDPTNFLARTAPYNGHWTPEQYSKFNEFGRTH